MVRCSSAVRALIKRAAAAEISPEMTDSRTTVVTTGISRVTKSRKPTSTAEEQRSETMVESVVRPATKLKVI